VALIPEIDQLATLLGGLVMVSPENTEQALNVSLTIQNLIEDKRVLRWRIVVILQ